MIAISAIWAWAIVGGLIAVGVMFGVLTALVNRRYVFVDGQVSGVVGRMGSGKSLFVVQRVLIPFCRRLSKRGHVLSASGRPVRRVITNFSFNTSTFPGIEVRTVQPTATDSIFAQLIAMAEDIGVHEGEGPWKDEHGVYRYGNAPAGVTTEPILNALVVLDEMHLFMEASKLSIGEDASFVISMARKYNCEIWWVSQHEMKIHKRLRDESSFIWLAGKITGPFAWLVSDGWHMARSYYTPAQVERARSQANSKTANPVRSIERRWYRYTAKVGRIYNSFELIVPDPSRRGGGNTARMLERRNGPVAVPDDVSELVD